MSQDILTNLYWAFFQVFSDKDSFNEELVIYNTRILKPKPQLDKIVIKEQKVVIQFMIFIADDEDEVDQQILLETTNSAGFTLSELMYQINNKVISEYKLNEQDSVFFEGLEYLTDDEPNYPQTKVYYMILGS
jgi:hypothetical protein